MTIAPPRPALLEIDNVVQISPDDGFTAKEDAPAESIVECYIDLPSQKIYEFDIVTTREATAVVVARKSDVDTVFERKPPVIVFLHGFSQRPRNYASMLHLLAAHGYVVIAPRVWLFDIVFGKVEGAKREGKLFASMPAKLQTALLIDTVRCVKWAIDNLSVHNVTLVGHSMGGALALTAAQALGTRVTSVLTLAPAVGPTEITEVNKLVSLKDGDFEKFASLFKNIPVMIAHGSKDLVVPERDIDRVFKAFDEADRPDIAGHVEISRGSHVGYQDTLDVDVPIVKRLDWLLFKIVDLFVFGPIDVLSERNERQLEYTKQLLLVWLANNWEFGLGNGDIRATVGEIDIDEELAAVRWGS